MERILEGSHPMFQVHDEKLLLDHGGRIVEGQKVWKGVAVVFRLLKHSVLIETGDHANRFCHEVIGVADHIVALL